MSVRTPLEELSSIDRGGDVVDYLLDSDGLNYGAFVEVPSGIRRDRGRNDWYEAHLVDEDGDGVIRYIELEASGESPAFSDLKRHLKRHGSPIDELFTVIAYREADEGPLTSPLSDALTFLRIEEQFSSEDVEVTFDLNYFTVDRTGVEPSYLDYLDSLAVNVGQGRSSLEGDVAEVFSIREITRSFYRDFGEIFREDLQDAIHGLQNPEENLNAYTRTVVNRVLFLLFIEEKGWLDGDVDYVENRYEAVAEAEDLHVYDDLFEPLFFEALSEQGTTESDRLGRIPFLNGGLFERRDVESDVEIDESFFHTLLSPEAGADGEPKGFLRRYKISLRESNPSEQELVVDPEFIGRIFEMFMQEDERSEVGAFYTPKPITAYMTKNALKQHLLGQTDIDHGEAVSLVSDHEAPESLTEEQVDAVDEALRSATVLDPAVGSGAFVIAMLEELVAVAEALDDTRGDDRSRFRLKEDFIADTLYGVDIDAGGIELAKFRVWLHLMQDLDVGHEEFLEANDEFALPNLGFKFFVGNSLVGEHDPTNVEAQQETLTGGLDSTLEEIHEVRTQYQTAHGDEKDRLAERLEELTDELDTQLAVEKSSWMTEVAEETDETFAWTLNIPEVILDGGFDIVIGNPPYRGGSGSPDYVNELGRFYSNRYDFYKKVPRMQYDFYQKFIIRAWELVVDGGIVSYITSNTFRSLESKETTRRILQDNQLNQLVLANSDTFDASVNPAIFNFRKTESTPKNRFLFIDAKDQEIGTYRELTRIISEKVNKTQVREVENNPEVYDINVDLYRNTFHRVFFLPTKRNIGLSTTVMEEAKSVSEEWEKVLRDTRRIRSNSKEIISHTSNLSEGDVTLFGLATRGGLGLKTGDNNEFLAYLDGSESAENVKTKYDDFEYVQKNAESDDLKRGELSRVIKPKHVADVEDLSEEEKLNGICEERTDTWVPIEKGFTSGDEYFKDTDTYINWTTESLEGIRNTDNGLIRNPEQNFSEGLYFVIGGHASLRTRYTNNRVIVSGNLFTPRNSEKVTPKYLLGIINSSTAKHIYESFINESGVSTTYLRFIPIVVPTDQERNAVVDLVDEIIEAKRNENTSKVNELQNQINKVVDNIYGINT